MLRTLTGALVALALAATAMAGEFNDKKLRFRMSVPEGWTNGPLPVEEMAANLGSPRVLVTGGNCNVGALANGAQSLSQEQLEQAVSGQFTEAFWKAAFAGIKLYKTTTIDKFGDRQQRGRKVFFVKTTSTAEVEGMQLSVTQAMDVHVTPGFTFTVTCSALTEAFEAEAADFDTIMLSFEPTPQLTVADAVVRMRIDPATLRTQVQKVTTDAAAAGLARTAHNRAH